jgi:hypothetical protein
VGEKALGFETLEAEVVAGAEPDVEDGGGGTGELAAAGDLEDGVAGADDVGEEGGGGGAFFAGAAAVVGAGAAGAGVALGEGFAGEDLEWGDGEFFDGWGIEGAPAVWGEVIDAAEVGCELGGEGWVDGTGHAVDGEGGALGREALGWGAACGGGEPAVELRDAVGGKHGSGRFEDGGLGSRAGLLRVRCEVLCRNWGWVWRGCGGGNSASVHAMFPGGGVKFRLGGR